MRIGSSPGMRSDKFHLKGSFAAWYWRGRGAVPDLGADRVAGGDDLLHARLDGAQILGVKGSARSKS